jgi:hypothetical protein
MQLQCFPPSGLVRKRRVSTHGEYGGSGAGKSRLIIPGQPLRNQGSASGRLIIPGQNRPPPHMPPGQGNFPELATETRSSAPTSPRNFRPPSGMNESRACTMELGWQCKLSRRSLCTPIASGKEIGVNYRESWDNAYTLPMILHWLTWMFELTCCSQIVCIQEHVVATTSYMPQSMRRIWRTPCRFHE